MLTALYASVAISIFYWYASVTLVDSWKTVTGIAIPWARWPVRFVVWGLALFWLARTRVVELQFEQESAPVLQPIQLSVKGSRALREEKERAEKQQKDKGRLQTRSR